ncbi:adhesin [Streptomyces sp. NPDC059176]|uniref:adhesin n=1 Tax=Streptomyces sp. NPDC059176 TaxID=3346758 RepID=UPI0036A79D9F
MGSLFVRLRTGLIAAGTVVVLGCVVAAAALLGGPDDERDPAAQESNDIEGLGVPTRLGPTSLPGGAEGEGRDAPSDGPSTPSGTGFVQWAGPGCPTGHYRERGRFENGTAAWYTVPSGGSREGACDGSFTAVPMSGSATKDRGGTVVWSWDLDRDYRRCSLAVFVPRTNRAGDAAGDPTFYQVLADPTDQTSGYTGFGVRQTAHRGELVPVSSYPVKGDRTFAVELLNRGLDWGNAARLGAHHAAAQMKLTCGN